MSELLKKYESIDQSKLNEGAIKIVNRVKTITSDFTTDDAKNNKIANDVLDEIMKKFPDSVKIVKRSTKAKPAPKKVAKAKKPATTSTAKKSGNNIMSVAKEIQKAGESWKEAMERAKQVLKERREGVVAQKKSELEKLYALVKTKKELQGFANSDIERDSVRESKSKGSRVVTREGFTSNQYKQNVPNKLGRKYWESRENRSDRLAPNYQKDMPLLASGGAIENIAVTYGKMLNDLSKEKQFNKKTEKNAMVNRYAKENDITIDNNNIIYIKGQKIAFIDKINQKTGQFKTNWDIKKFADGGMMDNMSIHNSTDFFNTPVYANGGSTQGYDDREDERLAMKYGKIANKDLDSTHSRRDDARFEERGKMANGGSVNMDKHVWEGWTVGDFIEELEPTFNQIMSGGSWQKPFKTKDEVKAWAMDNQPYYKKNIPDVVNYFWAKVQSKSKYANGGMFEAPIPMMREVKGKTVSVPVSGETYSSEISEFVDYVDGFYGKKGIYAEDLDGGFTKAEIKKAVNKYIENLNANGTWGGGDSLDRERVRQILQPSYRLYKDGGSVEVGDRVTIITTSLGKDYVGMSGTINDRKLLNDKYSVKLANGLDMAFSKDEFKHDSINPRFLDGGMNNLTIQNVSFEKGGIFYKEGSNKYGLGKTEIFVQEENDMYCVYDNVYNDEKENWEIKKLADFETMDEAKEFAIELSKKQYADGGSLPFMTDPNFGNFQNTGAFANGGSIGDLTEQEFLKKYFGANVFTENPSQYFEIKKMSSSDDAKVSAFVKELKADGFTVKKRAYSDFTSVMGVKKKASFELGGAFVMTDLAGHTGGSDGLGNQMPLSGVSGTYYTGLVGETGAMSSGELFMDGGAMAQNQQVINDASQSYVNYYLGEGASQGIYKDGGAIKNQYKDRTDKDIWNSFSIAQRQHFLKDHFEEIQTVATNSGVNNINHFGNLIGWANRDYEDLPKYIKSPFNYHTESGQYASGGSIPNNYEGRTPEDVWNNLTPKQKEHFLLDHSDEFLNENEGFDAIEKFKKSWNKLPNDVQESFESHIEMGQYAYGGRTKSRPSMRELYIEQIASLTNTRTVGVDAFAEEHNLTDSELSNLMSGLGRKMISQSDFITALVGNKNNPIQKEVIAFAKSDKAYKMADGGSVNGTLNKKIQKLAEKKGLTMDTLGRDEYNKVMTQALVESLTDANFHEEAKEVVVKAEGKTEWSDELYEAESFNPDEEVSSFAREVARECEWGGNDILNAYFFITKMQGSKVATMIDNLFFNKKPKTTTSSKPTKYIDNDDIESVTLNVNGNFITFAGKDFLNGANLMEKGGDLSKIATYFPIRDIVKVTLKNGETIKPLNGYWLKKGSEPMGKKNASTPTKTGKVTSPNYPNVNFNHKVVINGKTINLALAKSYVTGLNGSRQYDFIDVDGNPMTGYGFSVKEALKQVEDFGNNPMYYSQTTNTPPKIDETKAHFKMDVSGGGKFEVFVDSNFVNQSQGNLPNTELKHYGYGDFYLQTPDGNIDFIRTSEEKQGFVGRTHKMKGSDELVLKLVNAMKEKGRFESTQTFADGGFMNDVYADGGTMSEDISECKKLVSAFCKEFGDKFGLDEEAILEKVKFQDYLGHGASVFISLSITSNVEDLKVGETRPTSGYIKLASDINPNGVTGKDDISRTYDIDIEIKGITRYTQRRTDDGRYFKSYNYGRTIEEVMDKTDTKIIYDLYSLEKKDDLKFKMSSLFADGGEMQGNNIDAELEDFDLDNLDTFETMQYNHAIKSFDKVGALQILINSVEGDYTQLSPELAELAEMQMSTEEYDEATREMRFERDGYAKGGSLNVGEERELKTFVNSLFNRAKNKIANDKGNSLFVLSDTVIATKDSLGNPSFYLGVKKVQNSRPTYVVGSGFLSSDMLVYESYKKDSRFLETESIVEAKKFLTDKVKKQILHLRNRSVMADGGFMNDVYAKGGNVAKSGYAIMQRGELRTDAYGKVEFFDTKEKALFKMSHVPIFKSLTKEEKLKLIVPFTKDKKFADGGFMNNVYAKGGELKGKFLAEIKVPYNYESVVKDEFEFTEFLSKALTKKWFGNGIWGVKIIKPLFERDYSKRIVVEIEIPVGVTQGGGLDKFDVGEFISKTLTKKWFGNGIWGVDIVRGYADGGMFEENDGFMKADNEFNYRYPTKEVYIETLDEDIDLTSYDSDSNEVVISPIDENIDLNDDNRIRARMTQSNRGSAENFGKINPRAFEFIDLPMPTSNKHKND